MKEQLEGTEEVGERRCGGRTGKRREGGKTAEDMIIRGITGGEEEEKEEYLEKRRGEEERRRRRRGREIIEKTKQKEEITEIYHKNITHSPLP